MRDSSALPYGKDWMLKKLSLLECNQRKQVVFSVFCINHLLNDTLCCKKFLGIDLVLVLLNFEKSTNTNTIPAFGLVFLYNMYCSSVHVIFYN